MGIGPSIVFTGLCALVMGGDSEPGQVLLVDAKSIPVVNGVAFPEHAPTLVMSLDDLVNAEASYPTRVVAAWPAAGELATDAPGSRVAGGSFGRIGFWDLTGAEVRIRVQGRSQQGLRMFRPQDGASSWPSPPRDANDADAWRDLRFVADMNALAGDGRIDPALVADGDDATRGLPRGVATRVFLDDGVVEAGIPSLARYRDDVFEFVNGKNGPTLRQALTDSIRWTLATNGAAVVIEITPAAGGPAKRLVVSPRAGSQHIFIGNLPKDGADHVHQTLSTEEMAALHFGVYYELLQHKPSDRPLPRLMVGQGRAATGTLTGPFCPPAVFRRN
jgi:hypothetical protein